MLNQRRKPRIVSITGTMQSWQHKPLSPEKKKRNKKKDTSIGTGRNQDIMMEQNPFPVKRKNKEEGNKHLNSSQNQEEPGNHDGTDPLSGEKKEERRRRLAPEPEPEPGGTRKS